MSNLTGIVRARITEAQTPTIYNVTATLANTEYSQLLNNNTKQIIIRARGMATLQVAFQSGDTGTLFVTVPHGTTFVQDGLNYTGSVYFQSSKAGTIVEILEWT